MKIGGITLEAPKPKIVVIPRNDTEYVFHIGPVKESDWEYFNKVCPEPEVPHIQKVGQKDWIPDKDDKDYKEKMSKYLEQRINYMCIASLNYTPGLEFEHVKLDDPMTWEFFSKEMESAGFSGIEAAAIMQEIRNVNGLNPDMIEEATKAFIQRQAELRLSV